MSKCDKIMSFLPRLFLFFTITSSSFSCHALSPPSTKQPPPRTYRYFAYGSNMCTSTMTNLRNLSPLSSTAALLPYHELRFNIPGIPGIEPSSASVEPIPVTARNRHDDDDDKIEQISTETPAVHGVLYTLNERDFAAVCRTEGVPFVYTLHRCRVLPYAGDGKSAGRTRLQNALETRSANPTAAAANSTSDEFNMGMQAFTLRASRAQWRNSPDIPPSRSYLNVLIRGAVEYRLDEAYVNQLRKVSVGKTWVGNGLAEEMLWWAERRNVW